MKNKPQVKLLDHHGILEKTITGISEYASKPQVKEGWEKVTKQFHDTYERLAPKFGYETRLDTKQFDPNSPNGKLMTEVCREIIPSLLQEEREKLLEEIMPVLDDFSGAADVLIKNGLVTSCHEMHENIGFIKGVFLKGSALQAVKKR